MIDDDLVIHVPRTLPELPPPPPGLFLPEAGALERGWWYKWVGPALGSIVRRLRRSPRDQM